MMISYWFSREDGTTDYQTVPAQIGHTDTFDGTPIPCKRGLHASPTPWDALRYATGPRLWEVDIPDDAVPHAEDGAVDKHAACSRTYLRSVDLTPVLRQFAARQALGVIHLWQPPAVVLEYLTDEVDGKNRSDIRDAAWAAAWTAAGDAARTAAGDAARAAARAAAWTAAGDAARAAAWTAAWAAARAAAWAAARDAARDAASKMLNEMALAALDTDGATPAQEVTT